MLTVRLAEAESPSVKSMEQSFGIVPVPRFSEDQDTYYTMLHDAFTSLAIPTTVRNEQLDMISAVLESMASSGYHIIKPVYYDTILRSRIAQDPESARMHDIIVEGIRVDAGIFHSGSLNYFHLELRGLVSGNNGNVVSWCEKRERSDKRSIEKLNEKLQKLIEKETNS